MVQIVHQQAQAGIDIVSDGEFGNGIGWEQYAIERLSGFGPRQPLATESGGLSVAFRDMERFAEFYQEYWPQQELTEAVYPCVGPIRYTGHVALKRDIDDLKTAIAASDVVEGFLPVVAPASAIAISPNQYYKTDEEYVFAVAEALAEEYRTIVESGLIAQIDDAHLPFMYDRMVPPGTQ